MRRWGVVLIVLGVLLGGVGAVVSFLPVLRDQPVLVEEGVGVTAAAGEEIALYRGPGVREGSCTLVGPDGAGLEQERLLGSETFTVDGQEFVVTQVVRVAVSGEQVVTCSAPGFAVGPKLGVFGIVARVLASVFGGIAAIVVGVVLLVVGGRRNRPPGPWGGQQQPWPGAPQQPTWPQQPQSPGPPWPPQPPATGVSGPG